MICLPPFIPCLASVVLIRLRSLREEDREDKTTEERTEKIHFQCGGAWPFFVDVVICLVKPVKRPIPWPAEQCQVRFILDFSAPWPVNSFF